METVKIIGSLLVVLGLMLFIYGCYIYPKIYLWTDCDHDTVTEDWHFLRIVFGLSPILIVFGLNYLVELSELEFYALLLFSPVLIIILLHLLKRK